MSLLGPDDFGLTHKERLKKLAGDLSPDTLKVVEELLDMEDHRLAYEKLSKIVGREKAQRLIALQRQRMKRLDSDDPLKE
jgi:hypothetical protein